MKKRLKNIKPLIVILLGASIFFSCSDGQKKPAAAQVQQAVKYTCPMHPQVLEDHPGICPICGMTLVKKAGQASENAGISLKTVLEPVDASVLSSVQAVTPEQKTVPVSVSADGYLDFDTRTFNNIASRFSGRIEKIYVKYAFHEIHRGERIFDIYSPELVTAQQDLIYLNKNSPQETALIQAAKQKLLLLGMTDAQMEQVIKSGKAFYSLPVYSPYDGHVHDMPHSQMASTADTQMPPDLTANVPLAIKEGMYVEKGQTLFNVVDPHMLWAIIKINGSSMAPIKLHQSVTLSLSDEPDKTLNGQVDFIEPTLQNGDKTTTIRVYVHNMTHELKVGSLVKAEIQTGSDNGLWVPRTAVINLGQTKIVWLKTGGAYHAHHVMAGFSNGNTVRVTQGLTQKDSIAVNAQYLSDSESFIKTNENE